MPPPLSTRQSVLLTIAGYDPSNGAGITADLQTFAAQGYFGTSAITALTVQSTLGVTAVEPVSAFHLRQTLDFLNADLPPVGVKIGMLGSAENAEAIADHLESLRLSNGGTQKIFIVLDPIIKSSSGRELASQAILRSLEKRLLPLADWITPNWSELSALTGLAVTCIAEAESAASALGTLYSQLTVVATGGDQGEPIDLLRLRDGRTVCFGGEHVVSAATHGTGCAFSSALLCRLVAGDPPQDAVAAAKAYVTQAIRTAPGIGHGKGPMHLLWPLDDKKQ